MRYEPDADKVILSKEDKMYYDSLKRECKVFEPTYNNVHGNKPQFKHRKRYRK